MRKLLAVVLVLLGCSETSRVVYTRPPGIRAEDWKDCWARVQAMLDAHAGRLQGLTDMELECLKLELLQTCGTWRLMVFDPRRGYAKDFALDAFGAGMREREKNVCSMLSATERAEYRATFNFFWNLAIEEWVENPAERDALKQCAPRKAG